MKSSPRRSHGQPVPLPPQPLGRRPIRRAAWGPLFYILGRINPPCSKILVSPRTKMLGRRIRGGSGSPRESLLNPRHAALTGCLCHCLCHSRADAPCAGPHGDPFFTFSGESIRPAARFWPLQGQNAWTPHTRRQWVCPGKSSKSSPRRFHGLPAPLPLPQLGRPARRRPWAGCSPPTARPPPNRPGHGRRPASWRR